MNDNEPKEPSVLDHLKSKLSFGRSIRIEIPRIRFRVGKRNGSRSNICSSTFYTISLVIFNRFRAGTFSSTDVRAA